MSTRKGLGRAFVAIAVVSLLGVTGAWALAAPTEGPGRTAAQGTPEPLTPPASPISFEIPDDEPSHAAAERPDERAEPRPRSKTVVEESSPEPRRHLLAAIEQDMPITATPGGNRVVGEMPAVSPYLGTQHIAWVLEQSEDGRFGLVTVPYSAPVRTGWIRLDGVRLSRTAYSVQADLSEHSITVKRFEDTIMRIPAATGAAGSPTPPGRYFVVDRVAIPEGGSFGTYAFGLSGIQPNLPDGWQGGNQLAIHGTSDPGSIGTSASAGCLRVSEGALERLKPVLRFGTPVIVEP